MRWCAATRRWSKRKLAPVRTMQFRMASKALALCPPAERGPRRLLSKDVEMVRPSQRSGPSAEMGLRSRLFLPGVVRSSGMAVDTRSLSPLRLPVVLNNTGRRFGGSSAEPSIQIAVACGPHRRTPPSRWEDPPQHVCNVHICVAVVAGGGPGQRHLDIFRDNVCTYARQCGTRGACSALWTTGETPDSIQGFLCSRERGFT